MFTKKDISATAFQMVRYAYGVDRVINKNTLFIDLGMNQYDTMLIIMAMETKFDINMDNADVLGINNTKTLVDTVIRLLKKTGRYKDEHKPRIPRPEKIKLVDSPTETIDPDKESIPDEEDPEEMEQVAEGIESSVEANLKVPKEIIYSGAEQLEPEHEIKEEDLEQSKQEVEDLHAHESAHAGEPDYQDPDYQNEVTPEPLLDSGTEGDAIRQELETEGSERTIVISDPEEEEGDK